MNTNTETSKHITANQLKEIKTELAKLKPVKVTLDGNRSMTVKEAVFALAPTLERMKKRGFDTQEIAEKLHEKGIEIKAPTLAKYLNEFRRGKGQGNEQKKDTPLAPNGLVRSAPPDGQPQQASTHKGTASTFGSVVSDFQGEP